MAPHPSSRGHFADRHDAGLRLAHRLNPYRGAGTVVLALPRGGVPVGYEIARALHAPLDVLLVRKLRAPGFPELGLGAIVDGQPPLRVLNEDVLTMVPPPPGYLEAEAEQQLELIAQRRRRYFGGATPQSLEGRTVILTDDGIATGGSVKVALKAIALSGARRVVLAIPVAPESSLAELAGAADEVVCLLPRQDFHSVGYYYDDFEQTSDEEVVRLLMKARAARHA